MDYLAQVEFPLFIIALIANIALALIVFFYAPKNISRYLFVFFVTIQVTWIGANYIYFNRSLQFLNSHPLPVSRLTMFFATFHAFAFFLFIYSFLQKENILKKRLLIPFIALAVVIGGLTLPPYVFTHIIIDANANPPPQTGSGISNL